MRNLLAATVMVACSLPVCAQTKLLRFPDVHGERVVFTYAGDLWQAPIAGGTATKLTSARGVELFARYSPDGRWIAFTGQIDGDEQVYVVPSEGGEPRQLTFYPAQGPLPDRWGYDHQVLGWTPDGTAVLYRANDGQWSHARCRLYTVPLPSLWKTRGALPTALPMPNAGSGTFAPDGNLIVYSPLFRDFRTWKRYAGGWAQDLFVFTPGGTAENITRDPRTDRDPMWIGDRIWYASDRTGTLNLWSYDSKTQQSIQETFSTTWDVRWPAAGGPGEERIVYEQGGELCWFDCKARKAHPIQIRVPDEGLQARPSDVSAQGRIEDAALSPGGRRTAFAARGDILTVPLEHGDVRNLTKSPGAHDRAPAWSPDGSKLAFVSDRGGDDQLWLVDQLGASEPSELTPAFAARLFAPVWSPDGQRIAFGDKDGVLRVVELATKKITVVADEVRGTIDDAVWSPCSGHLAFTMSGQNELPAVHVWSVADGALHRVSRPLCNDRNPAWDARGERLFFIGLRGFQPRLATTYEWDFQIDRAFGVYALALRKDLAPWLPRQSDEAAALTKEAAKETAKDTPKFTAKVAIDFDGLADRVEPMPVPLDNWSALHAVPAGLLLQRSPAPFYGRESADKATVSLFDRTSRKLVELASDAAIAAVSTDGDKLLLRAGPRWLVANATAAGKDDQKELALDGLVVTRVPQDEWWQIFREVWRRYRDYFYVANMHGYDWEALRERYAPLVAHVRHRSDLTYVLGELVAELNVGHAYVSGGDIDAPKRVPVALLGAELKFDPTINHYRIARVLHGANDDATYRSPLTAVGVDVPDGSILFAIDGEDLLPETSPFKLLRGKLGRRVVLTIGAAAVRSAARDVEIEPIADEGKLHYFAWVEHNRAVVQEQSGGAFGYVHLPDMGEDGIAEFIRQYYAQRDKQGLVIDDRGNGGGNVSQMVLNRLNRKLLMCTFGRTTGTTLYPSATFHGHLVCLLDETSASDGDIFPAMFRRAGLGPLIGKRSWGGIIGITDRGPLLDGGTVNVPEFGNTEPGPEWTIEGQGVVPDIEVDNDVSSLLAGKDPQLERAIVELKAILAKDPRPKPVPPPPPVKTGR